jgi:hypothetical protein
MFFAGDSMDNHQYFSKEIVRIQDAPSPFMFQWELERVAERQLMRSKGMNILRRRVPAVEADANEMNAEGTVRQRIEVTVEREVVSVLVRGGRKGSSAKNPGGNAGGSELGPAELPPPQREKGRE